MYAPPKDLLRPSFQFRLPNLAPETNMRKVIRTTHAPRPRGVYSQAVVDGDFVFVAGQGSINPVTNELELGDIRSETRRKLKNMQTVLQPSGSDTNEIERH